MFEPVDTSPDFVKLEHKVLGFWESTNAFDKLRAINAGKPPWSFLDGPITANNPMGVHHAWGRTYKDAFHRYFAMNRRELRYQNGFDCQGLWVEVEVQKELGLDSKREIEAQGLEKFTETCKARVEKYSRIQSEQSQRLGYWMDWSDSYYTMSETNNYTIWRFLKACHERGFIYKGTDVMPWSGKSGSAYSDMEVKEGRKLTTHTSVFVRFPIRGRDNEFLLVWTTTPWTLTGNVGVAVNGELDYAKVRAEKDGALYYVAQANLEHQRLAKEFKEGFPPFGPWPKGLGKLKTIAQMFKEQGGCTVEGTVKGSALVGLSYDGPFDELPVQAMTGGLADPPYLIPEDQRGWKAAKDAHVVIDPGKDNRGEAYVQAGEGTGLVHTAPGSGDVDHGWGQANQLVSISPLDGRGNFIAGFGPFEGMNPNDGETVEALLSSLRDKGLLFAAEEYPHIYPHCWRTGDPLVYRLVDEWFIGMDWRDEIMKTVDQVRWLPASMKGAERERDWLTTMRDWMISKKRYWGLALPIWECKACGWFDVIGSRDELGERASAGFEEFDAAGHTPHRPYVDDITIPCGRCSGQARRIADVGNPWLDAGIVAYSTVRYDTDRSYWDKWVPADLITESFPGQFRNWFYALLSMSTMMELAREDEAAAAGEAFERRPPFKNLLGHALVLNEHRVAMHKSDGTAIWFEEAADQIGVDTMRWMYCAQTPGVDLPFGLRHPDQPVELDVGTGETLTHTVDGAPLCKVTSGPADETRRRVLLTLWNSYAFFCNYARLDGFDPGAPRVPVAERPDIDRWILSDLQLVVRAARASFENYEIETVCKRTERFIDDLSNWYIRRNRRRFWRGVGEGRAADRDKAAAHQTLYEVLETLTRLLAPVIPFLTETMYQNLVRGSAGATAGANAGANAGAATGAAAIADAPESVHHTEYPVADESLVDAELSAAMNATIRLVSLGRAVRNNEKIGVRQPLAKLTVVPREPAEKVAAERFADQIAEELNVKVVCVEAEAAFLTWQLKPDFKALGRRLGKAMKAVGGQLAQLDATATAERLRAGESITIEVDGKAIELGPDDIQILARVPENMAVTEDGGTVVALDTELTNALRREGLARDIVRQLQDLRKATGLQMEDRILLRTATDDAEVADALAAHGDTIKNEVLADELIEGLGDAPEDGETHDLAVRRKPALSLRAQIVKAGS